MDMVDMAMGFGWSGKKVNRVKRISLESTGNGRKAESTGRRETLISLGEIVQRLYNP